MPRRTSTEHTGPFSCSICQKEFTKKGTRDRHVAEVHENANIFECKQQCGKAFSAYSSLIRHERTHSGEKPFGCKICKKRFNRSDNLKAHQIVHSKTRPFQCCGKAFGTKSNLKAHLQSQSHQRKLKIHHSTGQRGSAHKQDQKEIGANVEQPDGGHHSSGKVSDRFEGAEEGGDYEPNESNEERGLEDKAGMNERVLGDEEQHGKQDHIELNERRSPDGSESDGNQEDGLRRPPAESGHVSSVKLKVVFDLEYRAPD